MSADTVSKKHKKNINLSLINSISLCFQNHWFTYNEKMSVESVTQAVSNLALAFGDDDADPGAMVGFYLHTGKLINVSCKNNRPRHSCLFSWILMTNFAGKP